MLNEFRLLILFRLHNGRTSKVDGLGRRGRLQWHCSCDMRGNDYCLSLMFVAVLLDSEQLHLTGHKKHPFIAVQIGIRAKNIFLAREIGKHERVAKWRIRGSIWLR